ncbi:hypothetical protein BGZ47_011694 [Haplosporangium gracile]|nr:hypothetical protein BGZ47_011694 [Haplosporangium gracile]
MTHRKDRKKAAPNAKAMNPDYVYLSHDIVSEPEGNNNNKNTIAIPPKKMRQQGCTGRGLPALPPTLLPAGRARMRLRDRANQVVAEHITKEKQAAAPQEQQHSLKRKREEWGDFEAFGNSSNDDDQNPHPNQGQDQEEHEHPWMRHDYSRQLTAIEMSTQEIKDFAEYLKPTPEEHAIRTYIFKAVEEFVANLWSGAKVHVYGSFNTQLYLPGSDMDIVIVMDTEKTGVLRTLANKIRSTGFGVHVEVILQTKVPIVKFQERRTGIHVDISLNQLDGFKTGGVVQQFLKQMPVLQPMTMLIKHFLKGKPVTFSEVHQGGLGSFSVTLLVMSFLQMHPLVQARRIDPLSNLGVLVIEFFELYGLCFNYNTVSISVTQGGSYIHKGGDGSQNERFGLTLINPVASQNVAKGTRNMSMIRASFVLAFQELTSAIRKRQDELDRHPRPAQEQSTTFISSKAIRHQHSMIDKVFRLPSYMETNRSEIYAIYHGRYFQKKFGELAQELGQGHDDQAMSLVGVERGLDKAAVSALLQAFRRHFPQNADLTTIKEFAASFKRELVREATSLGPSRPLLSGAEYESFIVEINKYSDAISGAKRESSSSRKSKKIPVTDKTVKLVTAETVENWQALIAKLQETIQKDRLQTVAMVMKEAANQEQGGNEETKTMQKGTIAAAQQQDVGSLESQASRLQDISQRVMEIFDAMDPNDTLQLTAFLPHYSELMEQQAQFGVRQVEHQGGILLSSEDRDQLVAWSNSALSDRLRSMDPIKMARLEEAQPLLNRCSKDNQEQGQGMTTPMATGSSSGFSESDAALGVYQAQESDEEHDYFEQNESEDGEDEASDRYFEDMMREAQEEYGTTDEDGDNQDSESTSSTSVGAHRDPQNIRSGNDSIQLSQLYSSPKDDYGVGISVGGSNSSRYEQLEKMRKRG